MDIDELKSPALYFGTTTGQLWIGPRRRRGVGVPVRLAAADPLREGRGGVSRTPPRQRVPAERTRATGLELAAILETALDAIIVMDGEGLVRDWNPAAERTFGYTRAEALGREMAELIIPEQLRERHRRGVRRAVETGRDAIAGQRIEIVAVRRSGEEFPVELAITRIVASGAPQMFAGHVRDISVRRRSEQRLAVGFAVTRVLAEAASVADATPRILQTVCDGLSWDLGAVWSVDQDALRCVAMWPVDSEPLAEFEEATRTAAFPLGTGLPGRIWASVEPVWIPDVTDDTNFPRAEMAARCGLRGAFGFPVRLGGQVLGVIEFFSREIRQPDAELLEMFAGIGAQLGQFIERRRVEAEIRQLNADLERRVGGRTSELAEANARLLAALAREQEIGRLKSNFVSLVSHEFRTPLGIILSSSEILDRYLDTLDANGRREQLDAIIDAVRRMSGLMEQVLMFSRIEAGQLEFRPEPLDLAGMCRRLRDELLSATGHRCPIAFVAETSLDGAVGDDKLIRHILTNLLTNAVKYSQAGEQVSFTARREGGRAVFLVVDRGLGIPESQMDRLFTAFHRARNVADIPGTGLGLVIVRNCLDVHGGDIHFESAEGAGTSVRVTLPLFPESTP